MVMWAGRTITSENCMTNKIICTVLLFSMRCGIGRYDWRLVCIRKGKTASTTEAWLNSKTVCVIVIWQLHTCNLLRPQCLLAFQYGGKREDPGRGRGRPVIQTLRKRGSGLKIRGPPPPPPVPPLDPPLSGIQIGCLCKLITRDDVVSQRLKCGSTFLSFSWESKIALFFLTFPTVSRARPEKLCDFYWLQLQITCKSGWIAQTKKKRYCVSKEGKSKLTA